MIEIKPNTPEVSEPPKNSWRVRFIAAALAVLVLAATVWILWFFLSPARTVAIPAGNSYSFAGYFLKVEKLTAQFCPGAPDTECAHWLYEDGALISYKAFDKPGVSFLYFGQTSRKTLELPGLRVEFKSINFKKNAAVFKLSKQEPPH